MIDEPFSLYRLLNECEFARCPALGLYEMEIHSRGFLFCRHHTRKLLIQDNQLQLAQSL